MIRRIKQLLRRFRRDEGGTITIEAVIMFPTLFVSCLATYVFFDAFRAQSVNLKAAYTISDALSREDRYITGTYLTNLWRMHGFLTHSNRDTKLRVSVIAWDQDEDTYYVCWSQNRGEAGNLVNSELKAWAEAERIPVLPPNEGVLLVQTWVTHEPIFSIGRNFSLEFEDFVVTSPRFAPQVMWSTNGTENGAVGCFS